MIHTTKLGDNWYAASCESHPHLQAEGRSRREAVKKLRGSIAQERVEQEIKDREDRQ